MPVLGDLYHLLRKQTEPEAQRLATALEIYVSGSLNVFNHRTNVKINSRIVCYVIKKLGKQLKKLGMQIVQDQVWGSVPFHLHLMVNAGKPHHIGIFRNFLSANNSPLC